MSSHDRKLLQEFYRYFSDVAELGDEICRGNPPVVAPTADGVSTGALPLQAHHTFIQQRHFSDVVIEFCDFVRSPAGIVQTEMS